MSRISYGVKNIIAVSALAVVLMLPASVNAETGWRGWFSFIRIEWDSFRKNCNQIIIEWTRTGTGSCRVNVSCVPEFSADATSGSIALLLGGSLILMGRRRKEQNQV